MFVVLVIVVLLVIILLSALYQKNTNAFCKSKRKLNGKTAIVTGGTAGMGLEIAKDFATRGARVIICSPYEKEGLEGREEIFKESGNSEVVFKHIDLSSLASVRKFANEILEHEDRLDILVNNAGVSPSLVDYRTEDSLNFIMQVHYFGHFLLTILLLPLLCKSAPSRIVNTYSFCYRLARLNLSSLCSHSNNWVTRMYIYAKAKLCNVYFTYELSKRLNNNGVVVNCVDPGAVGTMIFNGYRFLGIFIKLYTNYCFKTPKEGAQSAIQVAVDDSTETVSGKCFQNCKELPTFPWLSAEVSKQLWQKSVKLVKLTDVDLKGSLETSS